MKKDILEFYFKQILSMSDDGFIILDKDGIILDINDKYCDFLGVACDSIVGKNILELIPNTRMINVMKNKYIEEGVVHHYIKGKSKGQAVIANCSYVENSNKEVIGGVAQVKFRLQSLDVAKKITTEYDQLKFYKEEYESINKNQYNFDKLIGDSEEFIEVKKLGMKVCKTNFSVLLTGETGTGKEVFARSIHNSSERAKQPMVCINCAAIPEDLLESELFGYSEGAFTGAKKGGKKGKFLIANKGTLFLDEIGDMPLKMQSKLLRVLEEKEIEPIGGIESVPIDVRIIAATRKDIHKMVLEEEFREDLYYRLNVVNIEMVALRNRKADVLDLADYFLRKLNKEYKTNKIFTKSVKKSFQNYYWPGNIRELDNVIKSAYAASERANIDIYDLPSKVSIRKDNKNLHDLVKNYEKNLLLETLEKNNWNCLVTAKKLEVHRSVLYNKIAKYNLKRPEEKY